MLRWAQRHGRAVVNVAACVHKKWPLTYFKDFRVPPQFGLFWQMAYIQSGTSPTSCSLCRRQRGIQPGNSLHLKIILYVWIPNTKRTNRIDSSGYLRPIIPIGSVDGSTAKQNLASAPCNINQHKDDQLLQTNSM